MRREPQNPLGWLCQFTGSPLDCSHKGDQLFQGHYERANRINTAKILRCFPHCCPTHVPRSYCGSSLGVRLTLPATSKAHELVDQVQVYARFCSSDDQPYRVGGRLALTTVLGSVQSAANVHGEWVTSRLVRQDAHALHYELNPSGRWYYAWRSGKTIVQRFATHVLEVVVLLQRPKTDSDATEIIATTRSRAFRISSFRRSENTNSNRTVQSLARPMTTLDAVQVERSLHTQTRQFEHDLSSIFSAVSSIPISQLGPLIPMWNRFNAVSPVEIDRIPSRSDADRAVLTNLGWWLHVDTDIHEMLHRHAMRAASVIRDLVSLRRCYDEWLHWLHARVIQFVQTYRRSWYGVVYVASGHVEQIRPHSLNWESFVARARQLAVQLPHRSCVHMIYNSHCPPINGRWHCPAHTVYIEWAHHSSTDGLPMAAMLAYWQQIARIHTAFDPISSTLTIASLSTKPSNGTQLVLDGKPRWFDSLPHGESTLTTGAALGGQCFGDYTGYVNGDALNLELFSWPVERWHDHTLSVYINSAAYRWSWRLRAKDHELTAQVQVARGVLTTRDTGGFAFKSVRQKLGHVIEWRELCSATCSYWREADTERLDKY